MGRPNVDLSSKELIEEGDMGNIVVRAEKHLRNRWGSYADISTDGSKDPDSRGVGFGSYVPHTILSG